MRDEVFNRIFPHCAGREFVRGPMMAADHLAFILNMPLDSVNQDGEILAKGLLRAHHLYNPDFLVIFMDVSVEAEAMGVHLEYFRDQNPQPVWHPEITNVVSKNIIHEGRIPQLFRAAEICRTRLGSGYPLFVSLKDPFSLAALTVGIEDFLTLLVLQPAQAADLLQICTITQEILLNYIIDQGYIPFIGSPIASGSIIGFEQFKKFAAPYLESLLDIASKKKSFRCLHMCGYISQLKNAVVSLNLDLFSFEEWHPEMWEKLVSTIPMGYVATDLFVSAEPDKIKNAVRRCANTLPQPFILSTACDIPSTSKPELVKTMMSE